MHCVIITPGWYVVRDLESPKDLTVRNWPRVRYYSGKILSGKTVCCWLHAWVTPLFISIVIWNPAEKCTRKMQCFVFNRGLESLIVFGFSNILGFSTPNCTLPCEMCSYGSGYGLGSRRRLAMQNSTTW